MITRPAQSDLVRIYNFLNDLGAEHQANTVMRLLKNSFVSTQGSPSNGKPYDLSVAGETLQNVREVIVPYGKSGYSYLFWHDKSGKQILILTVRHFRENAYRLSFPFL
ncbi:MULTISPECIES: type II toxin-antitoxin system RelE/ParE family toxin [Neisseria]|uniref:type II toxin-antitoxin system RelE/ParE family toxin n=1 Tax=Neisseria TaxID=482 RepID=UPI0004A80119|nr:MULTISPECIES: type II toxin-antitoxin system RelE/ParE family toxin [Neisseria]MBG8840874.1 type II toxin-antitoxin system RelE/ParE family toxin [Neisseria meningitidis]MBW3863275.1 type II toxin-antitoxin system RelE/ParE family toxin [Neisseria meningitidis]